MRYCSFISLAVLLLFSPISAAAHETSLAIERPAPYKPQKTGLLFAPAFDRSQPALAYFRLENNWREVSTQDYLTFGQAFAIGALQPDDAIAARYGETLLPAQLDVKATHADGSVRHAAVTIATPELQPGERIDGALVKTITPEVNSFDASAILKNIYAFPIDLKFYFVDDATQTFSIDARTLALEALNKGAANFWLDGPLVKEVRIETEAAAHLQLRFDIRIYKDGDIRTSAQFANEKTFSPWNRNGVYDVIIGPPQAPAFAAKQVGHHRASNWRRVFWTGAQPKLHVIHDFQLLADASALLPLDASLGVFADTIARRDAALRDLPPLSPAFVERYMPAPGGRPDIGLYPQWTAHYITSQTEAAKRVMLAYADAAGAIPWHYRDEKTGAPVSIEDRPKFWADARGLEPQYAPDRPHEDVFASSDGGWTPDHAHKPALSATPWLVTADRYYADELAMQAAWAVFGRWPALRDGGVKAIDVEQVRASAWSLRDLSDAAYLLPDQHPSKEYLTRALDQNLMVARKKYIDQRFFKNAGALEGFFEEYINADPERISPWQNDYMALALALAAARGNEDALVLLSWSLNFHAGRLLSPGFEKEFAFAYRFPIKNAQTQNPLPSWEALTTAIRRNGKMGDAELQGYPDLGHGYVASAGAALVATAAQTQTGKAFEALAAFIKHTRFAPLWRPDAAAGARKHNQFLFALRMRDGALIGRKAIRFSKSGSGDSDFLIGDGGGNAINGEAGSDALFGFSGDDTLDGGDGPDILSGGDGNDTLTGGSGQDIFSYSGMGAGNDIITDFDVNSDEIHLSSRYFSDINAIMAALEADGEEARLTFPDQQGSIVFLGVQPHALRAARYKIQ